MRNFRPLTPYCVSRLIQILRGCYRFYIYRKRSKINTFQKGRCTHAWAAIVLLVGIAALSIFYKEKNNDNPFFRIAIVIFCPLKIIEIFLIFCKQKSLLEFIKSSLFKLKSFRLPAITTRIIFFSYNKHISENRLRNFLES